MALVAGLIAHGGTLGLVVEVGAAVGIAVLGLAAWLGTRKERS